MRKKTRIAAGVELEQLTRLFDENLETISRAVNWNATEVIRVLDPPDSAIDDYRQEGYLAIWIQLPGFDPTRSAMATFADRVARSALRSIARESRAAKRTPPGAPFGHQLKDYDLEHRLQVQRLVASLSGPDRDICRLLAQYSLADACRRSRLSRTSFYRAISRIRKAFVAAGMG